MTTVVCPECGTTGEIDPARRDAAEFCPRCDYPLFWARSNHGPAVIEESSTDLATRRLPGAGGHQVVGHRDCPNCGEHNPLGVRFCIRCATDMDPEPEPEPEVYIAPPTEAVEPIPVKRPWWPWALAAAVVLLIVVLLIAL